MTGVVSAGTAGRSPVRGSGLRPLQVAVCSRAGLRSGVWSVAPVHDAERAIEIGPERGAGAPEMRTHHGSWEVRVPPDTAQLHGLEDPVHRGPEVVAPVHAPAPGWTVALVLLIPVFALTSAAPPARSRARVLPEPALGRCTQLMVTLGEPDAEPLVLPPALDAGSLTGHDGTRIQLWGGQTMLEPELTRHLVRLRGRLAATVSPGPGRTAVFARFRAGTGVGVLADLGTI